MYYHTIRGRISPRVGMNLPTPGCRWAPPSWAPRPRFRPKLRCLSPAVEPSAMRTLGIPVPGIGLRQRRIGRAGRASCSTLLILGCVALAVPASAGAWEEPKAPEYSLSVTEGVTTLPEESILNTSGSVRPGVETALTIVHDNAVVAKDTDLHGNVWLHEVPQVGDVVNLEVPPGHPVGSVVYDGLPSIEPSVCAGSTNFSGQRTAGME